jgi:hypothetical protein
MLIAAGRLPGWRAFLAPAMGASFASLSLYLFLAILGTPGGVAGMAGWSFRAFGRPGWPRSNRGRGGAGQRDSVLVVWNWLPPGNPLEAPANLDSSRAQGNSVSTRGHVSKGCGSKPARQGTRHLQLQWPGGRSLCGRGAQSYSLRRILPCLWMWHHRGRRDQDDSDQYH